MDAGGARHLRDAGDGHLHVGGRDEHEVGQLVNDDDDVGQFFGDDDVLLARHDDFLVHLHSKAFGARLDLFLFRVSGNSGSCGTSFLFGRELNEPMLRTPTRAKIW